MCVEPTGGEWKSYCAWMNLSRLSANSVDVYWFIHTIERSTRDPSFAFNSFLNHQPYEASLAAQETARIIDIVIAAALGAHTKDLACFRISMLIVLLNGDD